MTEVPGAQFNVCFDALDLQVVRGAADHPALIDESAGKGAKRVRTFAELLAEVAAFAGALRALGVTAGDPVAIHGPLSADTAIAVLACARIGAVDVVPASDRPAALEIIPRPGSARPVLVVDSQDVEWEMAMRAGRTDPAAVVAVPTTNAGPRSAMAELVFPPLLAGAAITVGHG